MAIDGEEIRFRGVRKRKWGKYVAEIRSRKRSRISLGSYSTAYAAARANDIALFCLQGPNAASFNFTDSRFNSNAIKVGTEHINPSSHVIRAAAIAVVSAYDKIPRGDGEEAGPSAAGAASFEEAVPIEPSIRYREAVKDETDKVTEEEEIEAKYLLESPEHILFEESVQMARLQH